MKKIAPFFVAVILICTTVACTFNFGSTQVIKGSGVMSQEDRTVSEFHGVDLRGSGDVEITVGDEQSVVIKADDNILPLIETVVQQGILIIRTKDNTSFTSVRPVEITIHMKTMDSAEISGSGNMNIVGVDAETINIDLPGSGNINASGSAKMVDISLNGSGNIICRDLEVDSAVASLDGSGEITLNVSNDLVAKINGSGSIRYLGNPDTVDKTINGSGSVSPLP